MGYNLHAAAVREIEFVIHRAEKGGHLAKAAGVSIATQGDDLNELDEMIRDAVVGYYCDKPGVQAQRYLLALRRLGSRGVTKLPRDIDGRTLAR